METFLNVISATWIVFAAIVVVACAFAPSKQKMDQVLNSGLK